MNTSSGRNVFCATSLVSNRRSAYELMKTTTLVAVISYADLLFETNEVAQKTFRPLEVFTVTALIYFFIIFAASTVVRGVERRLAASGEGMAR